MKIKLNSEQLAELIDSGCLSIEPEEDASELYTKKGFYVYFEFDKGLKFEYGEIVSPDSEYQGKFVFDVGDLDKIRERKPAEGTHTYSSCPKCYMPLIYEFRYCPKCGQCIKWEAKNE